MSGLNTISLGAAAASIYDMLSAHPMPLVRGARVPAALDLIEKQTPDALFPNSFSPALAAAGLWLAAGNWNRAHEISQDVATPDGAYWHAIVHRQEPDAGNAKYWFRQVGEHPVFAMLSEFTGDRGIRPASSTFAWEPPARPARPPSARCSTSNGGRF